MAHTRIRKFNTKDTYPEQKLDNDLCQAVVAGNTVYLRGQIAQDLDTRASLHVGDAGRSRGSPSGAPWAAHLSIRSISRSVGRRWPTNSPKPGSDFHGGITRAFVTSAIKRARCLAAA